MTALRISAIVGNILWMALVIVGCAWQGTGAAQASLVLFAAVGALNLHALRSKQKSLDLVVTAMNGFVVLYSIVSAVASPMSSTRSGSLLLLVVTLLNIVAFVARNREWLFRRPKTVESIRQNRTLERVH